MLEAAKKQGYYREDIFGTKYDKIQVVSVEDLLENKKPLMPESTKGTFKKAKKSIEKNKGLGKLFE
jgi:hypothetical protein